MKKVISLSICLLVVFALYAQEQEKVYLRFENNANVFGGSNKQSMLDLMDILNMDVFNYNYYSLLDYRTELQRKVFLESPEGRKLSKELEEKRNKILSTNTYTFHPFEYGNRYDLKTKSFMIAEGTSRLDLIKRGSMMSLPELQGLWTYRYLIVDFANKNQMIESKTSENNRRILYLPMSEDVALRIENASENHDLNVVIELRVSGMSHGYVKGTYVNLYIVDAKTKEIYYSFDGDKLKELRQIQMKEEQERQRLEAEKKRKEQEKAAKLEAERKAKAARLAAERRAKIDSFLAGRDSEVYDISSLNAVDYSAFKNRLESTLVSVVGMVDVDNLTLSVKDGVSVDYNGITQHNVEIVGASSYPQLEERIQTEFAKIKFQPVKMRIPGTDTVCAVSSKDDFEFKYSVETQSDELKIKKNRDVYALKSGDGTFYQRNRTDINASLTNGSGVYHVVATSRTTNGDKKVDVTIEKFRSVVPSFMIGYNFSTLAPVGFTVGMNNIACSNFGVFAKINFGNKSQDVKHPMEGAASASEKRSHVDFSIGATCSVTKYGLVYVGAGYGGVKYSSPVANMENGEWDYDNPTVQKFGGFNIDAGIVIRPIKWLGVNLGYNYVFGNNSYGAFNAGLIFFISRSE